jgi:hypothetical protein
MTSPDQRSDDNARRGGVRRTALVVAAIAAVIYIGFILSGVLAK